MPKMTWYTKMVIAKDIYQKIEELSKQDKVTTFTIVERAIKLYIKAKDQKVLNKIIKIMPKKSHRKGGK